jgi:hypothetical protein
LGDQVKEPKETFVVNLTNASGGKLRKKQGVGTILDYVGAALADDPTALRG